LLIALLAGRHRLLVVDEVQVVPRLHAQGSKFRLPPAPVTIDQQQRFRVG
jgi:hypothetical protein